MSFSPSLPHPSSLSPISGLPSWKVALSLHSPDWEAQDPRNGRDWEGLLESPAPTPAPSRTPWMLPGALAMCGYYLLSLTPLSPSLMMPPDCEVPEQAWYTAQ